MAGAAADPSPPSRRGKADNFNYVFVSAVLTAVRTTAASAAAAAASAVGDGIGLRVRPSCFVVAGEGSDRSDHIFRADSSQLRFGYSCFGDRHAEWYLIHENERSGDAML